MTKHLGPLKERCGYHAGHPWFYLLGGDIPTPKQIQADAMASDCCGYKADDLRKIDKHCEPKRSDSLRKWQAKFRADLMSDLSIYREVVRELRKYRETQDWDTVPSCCNEHNELKAEKAEDEFLDFAASAILATEIEVQEFQARLDTYDEATVKALMENTKALEAINERIQENLKHAQVTEDGKRVFKSEDGTWGLDENGTRFDSQTRDMDSIPPTKVTAEEAEKDFEERDLLKRERTELLDYQEKLDDARERSNSDDFTKDELDDLDKELEAGMPQAVKRQLPDYEPLQETDLKSDFEASAELSMSELPGKAVTQTIAPSMN